MHTLNFVFQCIIPIFILFTVVYGFAKGGLVYNSFVSGAKDGIEIITGIFPYVLAIFLMVKTLEASGAYDLMKSMFAVAGTVLAIPPEVFSVALLKPLSNAASLSIFTEIVKSNGADSLASIMAAVIMGSAETTFYVLAVYLGTVGIKKPKYLIPVCLAADAAGIMIAITVVRIMF